MVQAKSLLAELVIITCIITSATKKSQYLRLSDKKKTVSEDSFIQVNCSVHGLKNNSKQAELRWEIGEERAEDNVKQVVLTPASVQLQIKDVKNTNAGLYTCLLLLPGGEEDKAKFQLYVKQEKDEVCSKYQFKCEKNKTCLFLRYRCDNLDDCGDGSDEKCDDDPCLNRFKCNNSRCIDFNFVCDHVDQCGDRSDEYQNCNVRPKSTSTTQSLSDENDHYTWLQVTVSTFIVVIVGLVFLISFIVIMVCRARLRRRRMARTLHHLMHQQYDGSTEQTVPMTGAIGDQRQFLLGPSHPHYGNIIVNVNNGVQYIPGYGVVDVPPPYSEVDNAVGSTHSPPPYSTLERQTVPTANNSVHQEHENEQNRHQANNCQHHQVPIGQRNMENINISPDFLQSLLSCATLSPDNSALPATAAAAPCSSFDHRNYLNQNPPASSNADRECSSGNLPKYSPECSQRASPNHADQRRVIERNTELHQDGLLPSATGGDNLDALKHSATIDDGASLPKPVTHDGVELSRGDNRCSFQSMPTESELGACVNYCPQDVHQPEDEDHKNDYNTSEEGKSLLDSEKSLVNLTPNLDQVQDNVNSSSITSSGFS